MASSLMRWSGCRRCWDESDLDELCLGRFLLDWHTYDYHNGCERGCGCGCGRRWNAYDYDYDSDSDTY